MNLYEQARLKAKEATDLLTKGAGEGESIADFETRVKSILEEAESLKARADMMKKASAIEEDAKSLDFKAELPTHSKSSQVDENGEDGVGIAKAVHIMKHGDISDTDSTVYREVYGGNAEQMLHDQVKDFNTYVRTGTPAKSITRQLWGTTHVKAMLQGGMTVAEVKATMVEGTDVLGGYAVPAEIGDGIIRNASGLTAVRNAGARVVQSASKSIQWMKVINPSSDGRYPNELRGFWANETKNPDESNFKWGQVEIPAHLYTYKLPMSVSLLEDAPNVASLFGEMVAEVLGMDEDNAFLIGDGVGKPRGILPSSANPNGITEVLTGSSGAITMDGLRALKRGIKSQYRNSNRASWVTNNGVGEDIELLKDSNNAYYVPKGLNVGERWMGATWRESEAMPAVAGGAYPILFGDFSGYVIVERLGLAIQRYNDSNTGANMVEFHVRRRIGGDLVEPWKLAVQKVTA